VHVLSVESGIVNEEDTYGSVDEELQRFRRSNVLGLLIEERIQSPHDVVVFYLHRIVYSQHRPEEIENTGKMGDYWIVFI
jgi:hypothetical protein